MKLVSLKTTAVIMLIGLSGPVVGQGNDSASTAAAASGGGEAGRVEIGAGATSAAATTGSSGPPSSSTAGPPPQPQDPGFAIRPTAHPFWGPAALPIVHDRPLRCALIAQPNARRHCEDRIRPEQASAGGRPLNGKSQP
jgi:hypothetical protein